MGQQIVFLSLDKGLLVVRNPAIFVLAHGVQRFTQVAENMEFIVQDRGVRHMRARRGLKWFPHVHYHKFDLGTFFRPQPLVEPVHALFGTVRAVEPDRTFLLKVRDHDVIGMAFMPGEFINAQDCRRRFVSEGLFCPHILLVRFLDRFPVKTEFFGHRFNRGVLAPPPEIIGKALGKIAGYPRKFLLTDDVILRTHYPSYLYVQGNLQTAAGKVPNLFGLAVVKSPMSVAADRTQCFF